MLARLALALQPDGAAVTLPESDVQLLPVASDALLPARDRLLKRKRMARSIEIRADAAGLEFKAYAPTPGRPPATQPNMR